MHRTIAAAFAALAAFAGTASADHLNITTEGARVEGGSLVFPDVLIDKNGYVVIHAVENGAPVLPGSVGHAPVMAGRSADVMVPVEGLAAGDYLAMIHYETNGNGRYDFGERTTDADAPGMRPDGSPYSVPFTLGEM